MKTQKEKLWKCTLKAENCYKSWKVKSCLVSTFFSLSLQQLFFIYSLLFFPIFSAQSTSQTETHTSRHRHRSHSYRLPNLLVIYDYKHKHWHSLLFNTAVFRCMHSNLFVILSHFPLKITRFISVLCQCFLSFFS